MDKQVIINRAKLEILSAGIVPNTVASFSELHEYVDANWYGGALEVTFHSDDTDFWNEVQDALDLWLKQGRA